MTKENYLFVYSHLTDSTTTGNLEVNYNQNMETLTIAL